MRYGVFRSIVGQTSYSLPVGDGHHAYQWQNTNPLIGKYAGAFRDQDRRHQGGG